LLIYLLSRQGWAEIQSAFVSIRLPTLLAAGGLIIGSRVAVVGRWFALLKSAEVDCSASEAFKITFAGLFAANFLPTTVGGDVVRLAELSHIQEKKAAYTASVVMDRAVGLLGMALLLPLGLIQAIAQLDLLQFGSISWPIAVSTTDERLTEKLKAGVRKYLVKPAGAFLESLNLWLLNPMGLAAAFGFTGLHMLCRFGALWLIFRDQGQSISFLQIASLWSLVYFITLVPISLNGLGLQEISTTFMYTQVGQVSASSALTVAILLRSLEMAASLPGAVFLPRLLGSREGR
jgi:uncharacterized protein (TIRG00374 family)